MSKRRKKVAFVALFAIDGYMQAAVVLVNQLANIDLKPMIFN